MSGIQQRKNALCILLTKTTAARNEIALSYHKVRGLYFLAVVFAATIVNTTFDVIINLSTYNAERIKLQ